MNSLRLSWLVEGWFQRPKVSALESFFTRLFFALIILYSLRGDMEGLTQEPNPVGLLKLLHKIDPHRTWLTWLADPNTFDLWTRIIALLLCFYVAGWGLPLVLPAIAVMHVLPFTLYDSQGYPHHGNQIISLLLLVQAGCVLWQAVTERRWNLGPPDEKLRGWLLWHSVTMVAATYFLSVITKMIVSHGLWLWKANNFALDMIKTQRQSYLNHLDPARAAIPESAQWMLDHPWTARLVFGSGLILETVCIFAIGNRLIAFIVGVSYLVMHRSIDALMGGVAFPYNELLDLTFFVGLPFGLAWAIEKTMSKPVRWGFIGGAMFGVPLSWWLFHPDAFHLKDLPDYLQALVNCLGTWASQRWNDFFRFTKALWLTSAACGTLGALIGWLLARKSLRPAAE